MIVLFVSVSCASRSRVMKYEQELNDIKVEVSNIRTLTDEMKADIAGMKLSMADVDESVRRQTDDIEEQRLYQQHLREIVGSIKDAVVRLETEKLTAKQEELKQMDADIKAAEDEASSIIVKTEKDGPVTKIITEKIPDIAPAPVKKPKKDAEQELTPGKAGFGYAVKDGVILWGGPTTNSDVLEILVSWQQLAILGKTESKGNTWWKVKTNDFTGYVNSKFIIISDQ